MRKTLSTSALLLLALVCPAFGQQVEPLLYTFKIADPASPVAKVQATFPAAGKESLDLMMPVWTPGYYSVEDYTTRVQNVVAKSAEGKDLAIEKSQKNRWRVATGGAAKVVLSYDLQCNGRSVTANSITPTFAVINGGAAFITMAEKNVSRPHHITLEVPADWDAVAAMPMPDRMERVANQFQFRAPDFDTVADAPILAGKLVITKFEVEGSPHFVVDAGNYGSWDAKAAAANLEKIVKAHHVLFKPAGGLPFKEYYFLSVFRQGGGGLEHMNSTLLTSSANGPPGGSRGYLSFVAHEYFHAFNVKRIRPVELGPFDYENPPRTPSLWISEGVTNYYPPLLLARSGISTQTDFLGTMSGQIRSLQNTAGRLKQTLADASRDVWTAGGTSGVGANTGNTISYYGKGAVVGFLLDARIRKVSDGKKSLDDVMNEALKRYGHPKPGFTPEQWVALNTEVVGSDMKEWFHKVLDTTEELDYSDVLEWYGLKFDSTDPRAGYNLQVRPDATEKQKQSLDRLTAKYEM